MHITSLNSTLNSTTTANNKTQYFYFTTVSDGLGFTLVGILVLLGVLGAVGNLLVILVVWKNKPMRNPTNLLLSSVALSDFIFILLSTTCNIITVLVMEIFTTQEFQSVSNASSFFFSAISSITLTLLATQRYNALVNPMKIQRRLNKRCAKIAICLIWLSALILSFLTTMTMCAAAKQVTQGQEAAASAQAYWAFFFTWYTLTFVIPVVVTAFCYGKIIIGVYVTKTICSQTTGQPQDISNKKKLTNMLLLITLVFMAARIPYIVVQTYAVLSSWTSLHADVVAVVSCVYNLSPCLNPIIYVAYNTNYREGVKKLLRRCFCENRDNQNMSWSSVGLT